MGETNYYSTYSNSIRYSSVVPRVLLAGYSRDFWSIHSPKDPGIRDHHTIPLIGMTKSKPATTYTDQI